MWQGSGCDCCLTQNLQGHPVRWCKILPEFDQCIKMKYLIYAIEIIDICRLQIHCPGPALWGYHLWPMINSVYVFWIGSLFLLLISWPKKKKLWLYFSGIRNGQMWSLLKLNICCHDWLNLEPRFQISLKASHLLLWPVTSIQFPGTRFVMSLYLALPFSNHFVINIEL